MKVWQKWRYQMLLKKHVNQCRLKGKVEVNMFYYKKNIGDYYKKTGRLSMLEHGAYTLLIDACYDRERFPTLDEAIDWSWARTDDEVAAVKFVLDKFFEFDGEFYVQSRIVDELAKYHQMAETNSRIAKQREEKRRERKQIVNESSTERDTSVNEAPPNQEPRTKNQEPLNNNINTIFVFWKDVFGKSDRTKLEGRRLTSIKSRLNDGYSVDEIKSAIINVSKSKYHIENGHTDIELICRNQINLDKYMALNGGVSPQSKATVQDSEKVQTTAVGEWVDF